MNRDLLSAGPRGDEEEEKTLPNASPCVKKTDESPCDAITDPQNRKGETETCDDERTGRNYQVIPGEDAMSGGWRISCRESESSKQRGKGKPLVPSMNKRVGMRGRHEA